MFPEASFLESPKEIFGKELQESALYLSPRCFKPCKGLNLQQQLPATWSDMSLPDLISHFRQSGISSLRINSNFCPHTNH